MNRTKVFSLLSALTGLLALPLASSAQVMLFERSFDIAGIVNPGDENILGQLNATVNVQFWDNYEIDMVDRMIVSVTNTGPATSEITGFWLLQPFIASPVNDTNGATSTLPDGGDPFLLRNGPATPFSSPNDWDLEVQLDSSLAQYGDINPNDTERRHYFGATSGTELALSSTGTFLFDFQPFVFDSSNWLNALGEDIPNVFVRWQSVFIDDTLDGESGKGFYSGPGYDPAIPEPSAVAAMAVFGLGGILLMRRRLTRKS